VLCFKIACQTDFEGSPARINLDCVLMLHQLIHRTADKVILEDTPQSVHIGRQIGSYQYYRFSIDASYTYELDCLFTRLQPEGCRSRPGRLNYGKTEDPGMRDKPLLIRLPAPSAVRLLTYTPMV
jgi:hypothetical protein